MIEFAVDVQGTHTNLFKMMLPLLTTICDPVNETKLPKVVKSRSRYPVNEMKPLKMIMPHFVEHSPIYRTALSARIRSMPVQSQNWYRAYSLDHVTHTSIRR